MVEWARLESECISNEIPRVRIPPPPQKACFSDQNHAFFISCLFQRSVIKPLPGKGFYLFTILPGRSKSPLHGRS